MPVIEFTRDHMREVSVQSVSLLSQLCQEELTCPSEELPQQMENPGEDMGRWQKPVRSGRAERRRGCVIF